MHTIQSVAILAQGIIGSFFLCRTVLQLISGSMAFNDYGVPTNADRNFKTHVVYSEAGDVTKTQMLMSLKLDCGHGHMGCYRKCSSCWKTMCEKCWLRCDEPVIKDILSAEVRHVIGTCWVNTCSHCREVNPKRFLIGIAQMIALAARSFPSFMVL